MDFELFDTAAPIRGEMQIRTVGLRVSSYATDYVGDSDGIPAMTASSRHILLSALQAKAVFDCGLRAINETQSNGTVCSMWRERCRHLLDPCQGKPV